MISEKFILFLITINSSMKINYHTHTTYSDGKNSMEEYVKVAIDNNFSEIGFSDHFILLPSGSFPPYSMKLNDLTKYINEARSLRKKYRSKIKIKIGIEVDFFPENCKDVAKILSKYPFDYTIIAVHYVNSFPFDTLDAINEWKNFDNNEIIRIYKSYYELVMESINIGLFDIVAHIDLIKKFGFIPNYDFRDYEKKLIDLIAQKDIVVEINSSGLRHPIKEIYPSERIVRIIAEKKIPVILSTDAHEVKHLIEGYEKVLDFARKFQLKKIATFNKRKRNIHELV